MATESRPLSQPMQTSPGTPRKVALHFYGGKWQLASWIVGFFPPHKCYLEPCGGAASVLLHKPRSRIETYNDLDSSVVNFFRVLHSSPEELVHKIRWTPWAREEFEHSLDPCDDPIEKARRFWVRQTMSIAGSHSPSGMRMCKKVAGGIAAVTNMDIGHLYQVAERFRGVQIENLDALAAIKRYWNKETLVYFDPPYLSYLRSRRHDKEYQHEPGDEFHGEAAQLLREYPGFVVVSGYDCEMYQELYEEHGWQRFNKKALANAGKSVVESVWLSPRTAAVYEHCRQLPLLPLGPSK